MSPPDDLLIGWFFSAANRFILAEPMVIHGIGTGRLKRGLRDWLASLPYVEHVVDAEQGDGGPGCSVIWVH